MAIDPLPSDHQLSPEERAWLKFVVTSPTPNDARAAFNAGMSAGIQFTMRQIGWTLEHRAQGVEDDE
jgi:hypothetical protein